MSIQSETFSRYAHSYEEAAEAFDSLVDTSSLSRNCKELVYLRALQEISKGNEHPKLAVPIPLALFAWSICRHFHFLRKLFFGIDLKKLNIMSSRVSRLARSIQLPASEKKQLSHALDLANQYCKPLLHKPERERIISLMPPSAKKKMLYNVFLDKVRIASKELKDKLTRFDEKRGLNDHLASLLFKVALKQIRDSPEVTFETAKTVEELLKIMLAPPSTSSQIVDRLEILKDDPPNNKLFLSAGSEDHATCLTVTKTANDTFRLVYYNTGDGVLQNHPEKSGRYQTFIVFDNIPPASLRDKGNWDALLAAMKSKNIEDSYNALRALAAGGSRTAAAKEEAFYEPLQEEGTCTVFCRLSLLRHEILSQPGDLETNMLQYKLVKALFRDAIWRTLNLKSPISRVDAKMAEYALEKLETANRHREFAAWAEDDQKSQAALQSLTNALGVPSPKLPKSTEARQKLFWKLSNDLISRWKEQGAVFTHTEKDPYLASTMRLYAIKKITS